MIGPPPTRAVARRGLPAGTSRSGSVGALISEAKEKSGGRARSRSRSRSSSRSPRKTKKDKAADQEKKDKEFAWMDSDDELEKAPSAKSPRRSLSSSSSSSDRPVSLENVETLGQMARLAPDLERRLEKGDVRSRELCDIAGALARSKFFDAGLFSKLAPELRRSFQKRRCGRFEILEVVCSLADLNAYNAELFEVACEALRPDIQGFDEPHRQRLETALKMVNHTPGDLFSSEMKLSRRDKREACPLFWRGQCKWGPKCKLSHDQDAFERTLRDGKWQAPSMNGGKSVGFKQSADLFKEDRCGALW